MGQVNLVRIEQNYLNPNSSITLSSGILADDPVVKATIASMVNGGIHSFVQAIELEINNGIGFSDDINFRNSRSLGLKLIHNLALQFRGNIEKDNSKSGTHYIITYQEIEQTS